MSYRSFINRTAGALLLLAALTGVSGARAQHPVPEKPKYVVLITIDGMRAAMVEDPSMPSPTLKRMAKDGIFVRRMNCVAPSSTYPSHTALVTGARPVHHGIYYNSRFTGNRPAVSNWYADSIRCRTIWQAARENGLTTCSLFWPVSTGCRHIDYNVPEYWSLDRNVDQLQFIRNYCTPEGIFDEIQANATGLLTSESFNPRTRNREGRTGYMAAYLFSRYRPNLTTIHFISTDAYQHATGTNSDETRMAVAAVDYGINQVLEGLRRYGLMDSTAVIVCGDHGFTDVEKLISPNVWLTEAGLLTDDPENWKAKFHGAGATMFLYLKDENDTKTLEAVRKKLASLPEATRRLFRIAEKEELAELGCDPKAALAVEPRYGVAVATNTTGPDITVKEAGKHGYLSPYDPTTLIAFGKGIPAGKVIDNIDITDVAPLVMELLGVDFGAPDGRLRPEMLKR